MQATIGCLSRLVSRSLVTGVVSSKDAQHCKEQTRLVTAVSGFPKAKAGGYNIENILRGQIGDDAYFVARHVDDWPSSSSSSSVDNSESAADETPTPPTSSPATAHAQSNGSPVAARSAASFTVLGVADGVGGWRQYGVDPGQFSRQLMYNCDRLVSTGYFSPRQVKPARLLAQGYREMQESKASVIGSSTACVMMLSHADLRLHTANIGDSGFLVVRNGEVVHRSREQQHSFNTPFQLSLPPSEMASDVLRDGPESADRYEFSVEDGDVILLATDGIFDNVPVDLLVDQIADCGNDCDDGGGGGSAASCSDEEFARSCEDAAVRLQKCANSIALIARKLSQDPNFLSPFAKNARAAGIAGVRGGKEDDITVLLAAVKIQQVQDEDPA